MTLAEKEDLVSPPMLLVMPLESDIKREWCLTQEHLEETAHYL
jgi:hypothetical protein